MTITSGLTVPTPEGVCRPLTEGNDMIRLVNPALPGLLVSPRVLTPGVDLTRASAGYGFDDLNRLTLLANNAPRRGPWRFDGQGRYIGQESGPPQSINWIVGPYGDGATTGLNGTIPGWTFPNLGGLFNREITLTTRNGRKGVLIRFFGQPNSTSATGINIGSGVSFPMPRTVVHSAYVEIVTALPATMSDIIFRSNSTANNTLVALSGAPAKAMERYSIKRNAVAEELIRPSFRWNFNDTTVSVDFTIFVGCLQTEYDVEAASPFFGPADGQIGPVARYPHNGHLIVEGARTSGVTRPRGMGGTGWGNSGVTATPSDGVPSPEAPGLRTARVTEDLTNSQHFTAIPSSITAGTVNTISAILRAGTGSFVQLCFTTAGWNTQCFANFDLATGAVTRVGTSATARITPVGGGWYWCQVTATATASNANSTGYIFSMLPDATAARLPSYTGTGLYFDAWAVWIEPAGSASTPVLCPEGTFVVSSRAVDVVTYNTGGLSQGTLIGTFVVAEPSLGSDQVLMSLDGVQGGGARYTLQLPGASTSLRGMHVRNGNPTYTGNLLALQAGVPFKAAIAWDLTGCSFAAGGTVISWRQGLMPPMGVLRLGNDSVAVRQLFGEIGPLDLYSTRLPDAALQALTA